MPFVPFGDLAREGVKSYVEAQRALMDAIMRPTNGHETAAKAERHVKRPAREARKAAAAV